MDMYTQHLVGKLRLSGARVELILLVKAFIRRVVRSAFHSADSRTVAELVSDSDVNLSESVLNNDNHVLAQVTSRTIKS